MTVKDTGEEGVKHVLSISLSCSNGNLNQPAGIDPAVLSLYLDLSRRAAGECGEKSKTTLTGSSNGLETS